MVLREHDPTGWVGRCRTALAPVLLERVVDACIFGWTTPLLGPAGPLGPAMASFVARSRAGGLPERFALVLTPTRLCAYGLLEASGEVDPGAELVTWSRSELQVRTSERNGLVDLRVTAAGRQIAVHAGAGGQAFVARLKEPP